MKSLFILYLLIVGLVSNETLAQNLVLNPSFETPECNLSGWFSYNALDWYNPTIASPDYYGLPPFPINCGVLTPNEGHTPRTGQYMAGLWGGQLDSESRDYIQTRMTEALIADSTYCVEMYILRQASAPLACDRFGIQLSVDSLYDLSTFQTLNGGIRLASPEGVYLTNDTEWMHLSWEYQAFGGERFITLGNHWDQSETSYIEVPATDSFEVAYYFVDDVSVTPCAVTSVPSLEIETNLWPNPVTDILYVSSNATLLHWEISSVEGKILDHGTGSDMIEIPMHEFSPALYIIEFSDMEGRRSVRRIFKK